MSGSLAERLASNMSGMLLSSEPTEPDATRPREPTAAPSTARNRVGNQPYGYHNTFHLHATPSSAPPHPPPPYNFAVSRPFRVQKANAEVLPRYKCTLFKEAQLGLKCELTSPFVLAAPSPSGWHDVHVILTGTQLRLYRPKNGTHVNLFGKAKEASLGRLIKAYSMQHAEVGLATDVKKSDPIPRSRFGLLIPLHARAKVFQTEPHLFEPVRDHVIRLRLETEQFILSASTQQEMLDWVEALCAAIDISMPLEDRSEPRYRSLPRRLRRQREVEGRVSTESPLSNLEGRTNLVRQQERIIRQLYPHLATENAVENARETLTNRSDQNSRDEEDPDVEDLDRGDAIVPSISLAEASPAPDSAINSYLDLLRPRTAPGLAASVPSISNFGRSVLSINSMQSSSPSGHTARTSISSTAGNDRKEARQPTPQLTAAATLRYRRRCAPVLLAASPRASDIVIAPKFPPQTRKKIEESLEVELRRVKLDMKKHRLVPWETLPPKYDAHAFPDVPLAMILERPVALATSQDAADRPATAPATGQAVEERPTTAPTRPVYIPKRVASVAVVDDDDSDEESDDEDFTFAPHPALCRNEADHPTFAAHPGVRPLLARGTTGSSDLSSTPTSNSAGNLSGASFSTLNFSTSARSASDPDEWITASLSRLHLPGSFNGTIQPDCAVDDITPVAMSWEAIASSLTLSPPQSPGLTKTIPKEEEKAVKKSRGHSIPTKLKLRRSSMSTAPEKGESGDRDVVQTVRPVIAGVVPGSGEATAFAAILF